MNLNRIYLYALYLLPILAIGGKLVGWITMTHNFFFDWVTEGMLLLFLFLEAKTIYAMLNPGVHMLRAAANEDLKFQIQVRKGWLWVGMILRLLLVLICASLAVLMIFFFRQPQYLMALILLYIAGLAIVGIASYLNHNPYRLLVTDLGIYSYIYKFRRISWDEVKGFEEKPDWLVMQRREKSDHDIDFEDLADSRRPLVSTLQAEAKSRNIPYMDRRRDFN